jgi:uncharacterized protein (TIGR02466 family)|tara:strand:- start:1274 stop:1933 length:660 start_codon:yes stop_codon:yes gene_type:complete
MAHRENLQNGYIRKISSKGNLRMMYELFPTAVGFYKLDRKLSSKELTTIRNLKTTNNTFNRVSNNKNILKNKSLLKLKEFFNDSLQDYVSKTIAPTEACEYYITNCWSNLNVDGESHFAHNHENSLVSAVFYVNAVKDRDCIVFEKNTVKLLTPETIEFNTYNSHTWRFPVETNQLYIFPSDLIHSVPPVGEGETRISISFNSFAHGEIGEINLPKIKL